MGNIFANLRAPSSGGSARHVTLTAAKLSWGPDSRIVVVGDVHGCADELEELLSKVKVRPGRDVVILCGDLVNKGPKSREVVRLARRIGALALVGNHEEHALKAYRARKMNPETAGREPGIDLERYGKKKWSWVDDMSQDEMDWLASLPYTISVPFLDPPVLCVHAGLVPGIPIEQQSTLDMTTMRNLVEAEGSGAASLSSPAAAAKGTPPPLERRYVALEKANAEGQAWAKCWGGPEHVYFGHDAKRRLQREAHATGLDTGCLYGGQLTACLLPAGELVQVDAKKVHVDKDAAK